VIRAIVAFKWNVITVSVWSTIVIFARAAITFVRHTITVSVCQCQSKRRIGTQITTYFFYIILNFLKTVKKTKIKFTISDAIFVSIGLTWIRNSWAIVTNISNAILINVVLILLSNSLAVVANVTPLITYFF
jgi:hypothetical protein